MGSTARLGLLLACLALACLALAGLPAGAQPPAFPDGVAAGDVTDQTAIVWARTAGAAAVRVEIGTDPQLRGAHRSAAARATPEAGFAAKVDLRGLRSGQRYYYRAVAPAGQSEIGSFVTAPAATTDAPLRLLWGADTMDLFQPFRVFHPMRARGADLFLYLGDTIYADIGPLRALTLEDYRRRYRVNREDTALRAFLASTATWVTWDDHEVANNFDRTHPRLAVGRQAFVEAWPIRGDPARPARLYRSLRWGRTAEIFILDTRQYRTPADAHDGPEKTMLGAEQKRWLFDGLTRSDAAVKIIATSVVLRFHARDSWGGYGRERDEILRFIRDRRIGPVIFLAGDVHYAAWIRHPEGPYEGVAGPLAAPPASAPHAAGRPGVQWASAGRFNYGWLRVADGAVRVGWYDEDDRPLYETHVPLAR
jgi:alkaline phosphatase D